MSTGGCWVEIQVAEVLDSHWQQWFLDLELVSLNDEQDTGTLLRGHLPDQAALFGLLSRLQALNLTLISVRRINAKL